MEKSVLHTECINAWKRQAQVSCESKGRLGVHRYDHTIEGVDMSLDKIFIFPCGILLGYGGRFIDRSLGRLGGRSGGICETMFVL